MGWLAVATLADRGEGGPPSESCVEATAPASAGRRTDQHRRRAEGEPVREYHPHGDRRC